MASCGHHYPVEGCHNCWEWVWEDYLRNNLLLDYLEEAGIVSEEQMDAARDEVERRRKGASDEES